MCTFYYIDGSVAMIIIAAFFVLEIFLGKGKIMKKIWTKALAYVLAVTMCLSAVNVPVYAQGSMVTEVSTEAETMSEAVTEEATVSGNDAEPTTEEVVSTEEATTDGNDGSTWDQVTTENVFEGENYKVTFTLTSNWDAGYNANVKLENTGDSTIQNWYLGFDYNNSITNIWNAEVSSNEGDEYVVKNVGWNQDIAAGNSIEFGLSGDHAFKGFPENYELLGTSTEVAEDDYTIQYMVDGDWGTGFYGSISVTNNTDTDLEDWVLEFDFDREITEIWNGVIEKHEGNHYVVRNAEYNSIIAPGENVSIGIKGCEGKWGDEPINFVLYSYSKAGNNQSIDLELDTDNDGVQDYLEDYFGTDKNKTDTDGDGLSDFVELYSLVLDPLNIDTDGNGVNDADEDLDGDGLSNICEFTIETSIVIVDTDEDGLNDNVEYNVHGTNPLSKDTDGDGASDSKEIEYGTNPLVYEDKFEVSYKAGGEDTVEASVDIVLDGTQIDSLAVEKFDDEFLFPVNMPGYIGGAYDFSVDGTFDKATIKFEFNEELLEDADFDPVIYYFNEEKQLLEELDTTVVGNVASTEVTHFSKYILLNRKVYQNSFEWQDVWNTTGFSGVEAILVIDDSGSMVSNDRYNQRLTVAQNLIDNLPENSKVGVVKFTSSTTKLTTSLTSDKETAKSYLTTSYFRSSGGTSMYTAINSSFSMFEATDDNILKMMIVLSDGATSYTYLHSSVVTTANNNGVKIYTVGLGSSSSSYFTQYLKPLANNTGGAFYLASDASQLEDIYKDINKKIDIETDSDNDGIADYYEENMVMFNGVTIKLDKNNPDSDGDGLLDGEEVAELNYQYNADKTQVIVTGKLLSNPLEEDTDGDGISDEEELVIGTDPKDDDTDNDGLKDGFEYTYWYDPLEKDVDGDGRSDLKEYQDGTDPYMYNKDWYEYAWDFICGFVAGDFIADTDSLPTIMGQITSSFIPFVDIRDVVGNCVNGDYAFAGLSALGLAPVVGDGAKTAGKIGKFVVKNIDDIPKIAGLLEFLSKNFPDAIKVLNKSDDFVDAAKQLSKLDNIKLTKKQAKVITEAFENAGLSHYLIKTSNSLDLKDTVNIGSEVWEQGAIKRGNDIDEFLNGHLAGTGLGKNFPVADRLLKDERILVSTKSLDIATQSYQNPNTLKNMLNKYGDSLKNIEKNYFDDGVLEWGGTTLKTSQYDKKALEIVLPDVIISEDALKVLNDFQTSMAKDGIEVWYRIVK